MVSKYQYKILKLLKRKSFITFNDIETRQKNKNILKYRRAVEDLKVQDYVRYTLYPHESTDPWFICDDFNEFWYLSLTFYGEAYINEHLKSLFMFWFPWAVTSLIAITSSVISILNFFSASP